MYEFKLSGLGKFSVPVTPGMTSPAFGLGSKAKTLLMVGSKPKLVILPGEVGVLTSAVPPSGVVNKPDLKACVGTIELPVRVVLYL